MGKRISQLDLATPLTGAEQFVLVQNSRTKRVTLDSIREDVDTSCQCTLTSRYNTVGVDNDTSEKFLQTYQMPANTMPSDGTWLEVYAWGSTASNNNQKTISLYFGGSVIYTQATATIPNKKWFLHSKIVRTTASTQIAITDNIIFNAANGQTASTSINMANVISIALSAQAAVANLNDITCEGFIIRVNKMDADS